MLTSGFSDLLKKFAKDITGDVFITCFQPTHKPANSNKLISENQPNNQSFPPPWMQECKENYLMKLKQQEGYLQSLPD